MDATRGIQRVVCKHLRQWISLPLAFSLLAVLTRTALAQPRALQIDDYSGGVSCSRNGEYVLVRASTQNIIPVDSSQTSSYILQGNLTSNQWRYANYGSASLWAQAESATVSDDGVLVTWHVGQFPNPYYGGVNMNLSTGFDLLGGTYVGTNGWYSGGSRNGTRHSISATPYGPWQTLIVTLNADRAANADLYIIPEGLASSVLSADGNMVGGWSGDAINATDTNFQNDVYIYFIDTARWVWISGWPDRPAGECGGTGFSTDNTIVFFFCNPSTSAYVSLTNMWNVTLGPPGERIQAMVGPNARFMLTTSGSTWIVRDRESATPDSPLDFTDLLGFRLDQVQPGMSGWDNGFFIVANIFNTTRWSGVSPNAVGTNYFYKVNLVDWTASIITNPPPLLPPANPPVAAPVAPPVAAPVAPPVVAPADPPPAATPVSPPMSPPVEAPVSAPIAIPAAPPLEAPASVSCTSPSPMQSAVCLNSSWIIAGSILISPAYTDGPTGYNGTEMSKLVVPAETKIVIRGDLIINTTNSSERTLFVSSTTRIVVEGCVSLSGTLSVDLNSADIKKQVGLLPLIDYGSACGSAQFDSLALTAPTCSAATGSQETVGTFLTVLFQTTQSDCAQGYSLATPTAVGVTVPLVLIAILVIVGVILYRRYRKRPNEEHELEKAISKSEKKHARSATAQKEAAIVAMQPSITTIASSDIKMLYELGSGSYGSVFLGQFNDGEFVAVKQLRDTGQNLADFFEEASLMASLPVHANIIHTLGVIADSSLYGICMEFCPQGSLDTLLARFKEELSTKNAKNGHKDQLLVRSEELLFKMIFGIANGMQVLAAKGYCHRDLAARNILLDEHLNPKISDFGYSRRVGAAAAAVTESNTGPIRWMSPENLSKRIFSEKSDVWAFGCLIVELLSGELPYATFLGTLPELALAIRERRVSPLTDLQSVAKDRNLQLPGWVMDGVLPSCLQFDPDQRPTFQQLIDTLRQNVELTVKYENSADEIGAIFLDSRSGMSVNKTDAHEANDSTYGPIRIGGSADPAPAESAVASGTQYSAISADYHTEKSRKSARMSGTLTSKAITKMIDSELNDSIKVLSKLGEGSFGTVYLCSAGSRYVALKRLAAPSSPSLSPQAAKKLRKTIYKEASLMTNLRSHKNVIQILGLRFDGDTAGIIMEFASRGSMLSFISKHRDLLSESLLFRFAIGIARGMQSLSSQGVVHRDLACRNVLLDSTLEPKISDFGHARAMESTPDFGKTQSTTGPIRWMAPENFNTLKYSEKSDVWSFGCLLVEIITGRVPYASMDTLDVYRLVKDGKLSPMTSKEDAPEINSAPQYISELIRSCCKYDPAKRPSFAEIVDFLLEHIPQSVAKSEGHREKRRIKREKLLEALSQFNL